MPVQEDPAQKKITELLGKHYPTFEQSYFPQEDITTLYTQNFSLKRIEKNLEISRNNYRLSYGALWPALTGTIESTRNRGGFIFPPNEFTSYSVGAALSFDIDPFGRLSALRDQAKENVFAAYYDSEALRLTLDNNFIKAFHQLIYAQKTVDIALENERIAERNLQITELRYQYGRVSLSDILSSKQNLENVRTNTETFKQSLITAKDAYATLLGQRMSELNMKDYDFPALPDYVHATSLPIGFLDQRPDIMAANARLEAAFANIDASFAALFPALAVSFSVDNIAQQFSDMLGKENYARALTGSLTQALFDGGQNRANLELSEAEADIAEIDYREAAIEAINGLFTAHQSLLQAEKILVSAERNLHAARDNLENAKLNYLAGRLELDRFLDIQTRSLDAEITYLTARRDIGDRYADLLLEMGRYSIGAATQENGQA